MTTTDPLRSSLRVATYNVHECVGTDGRHDPERVATVVTELDADIVALQEFTYPASVALETRSPVGLTMLDRYECALGPTRQTRRQECFGNALFTRHPIVDVHRIDLSMEKREPRGALAATIVKYLDSVRHSFFVVLGDFNDWLPGRSVVHVLDDRLGQQTRVASFPASWPVVPLDRIWVHPTGALQRIFTHATATSRLASDHLPVVADIDTHCFTALTTR